MRIGPIGSAEQKARLLEERARFVAAAAHVRENPPPLGIDAVVWAKQAEACEAMVVEIDEAVMDWESGE